MAVDSGPGLLAQHVVRDLAAPVGIHALGGGRGEIRERLTGQLAHARGGHAEHRRELRVGLPAAHHELENGSLVRRKLVKSRHEQGEG